MHLKSPRDLIYLVPGRHLIPEMTLRLNKRQGLYLKQQRASPNLSDPNTSAD